MTTEDNEDRFAGYLDQYVAYLEGVAEMPRINHLEDKDHRELSAMFRVIDANWASEIELPPLEKDPVALALGLVRPGASSQVLVAGGLIKAMRQAMKLSRSELVAVISTHGWAITPLELTLLERANAEILPVARAGALARALRTDIEALTPSSEDPVGEFVAWLYSVKFDQVVGIWAAGHGRTAESVAEEARTKMLAPARRSGGPGGRSQWLQMLHAVLEAME